MASQTQAHDGTFAQPAPPQRTSSKHRRDNDDDDGEGGEPKKRARIDTEQSSRSLPDVNEGTILKLSEIPLPRTRPHPTQNLIELYRLNALAVSVARKDPVTGEKINVLRKSYKGKIKDFPGKNDTILNANRFLDLLAYPDEEWTIQHVQGNEIEAQIAKDGSASSSAADFMGKLNTALDMLPGPLPPVERDKWRSIIDMEGSTVKPKPADTTLVRPPGAAAIKSEAEELRRPKRRGTARKYNDDAFEGYAEGFADDIEDGALDP